MSEYHMTLGELIAELRKVNRDRVLRPGMCNPHSYRGYYERLSFEPCSETTAGTLLDLATACVGKMFYGYKGGEYDMGKETLVHVCEYSTTADGDELTLLRLRQMLGDALDEKRVQSALDALDARLRALEDKRPLLERLEDEVRRIKPGTNVDPDVVIAPGTSRMNKDQPIVRDVFADHVQAAVLAERERCARIADCFTGGGGIGPAVAAEIRRGA